MTPQPPYRYTLTLNVALVGDGIHVGGHGAGETRRRIIDLIEELEHVRNVTASFPHYIGPNKPIEVPE